MTEIIADINPELPKLCSLEVCKIAVVGEAPGADEVKEGRPFIGRSGRLLRQTMEEAGLKPGYCYITNVFHTRPPDNAVGWFFVPKGSPNASKKYPPFDGKFLKKQWETEIDRLKFELFHLNPMVIISVGRTPLWAILNMTGITSVRGTFYNGSSFVNLPHVKVMPTLHPSYCLRNRSKVPLLRDDITEVVKYVYPK